MVRVLLVEDDMDISSSVCADLMACAEYSMYTAASAQEALAIDESFDIILLDIMLPDIDGIELCYLLRRRHSCPVIFISCLDDSSTIIDALAKGGDDYVVKPFDNQVLHARIQANLRRVKIERKLEEKQTHFECGGLVLDCAVGKVVKEGEEIMLLPMECRLLAFLMRNAGSYYKARELYREVWGRESAGDIRTVVVQMHNLRKKIETDMDTPKYIRNVSGKGYIFSY